MPKLLVKAVNTWVRSAFGNVFLIMQPEGVFVKVCLIFFGFSVVVKKTTGYWIGDAL